MVGGGLPTGRAARMLPTREGSGNLCPSSEPSHPSRSQLEPDRFLSFLCSFFKTLLSTCLVPRLGARHRDHSEEQDRVPALKSQEALTTGNAGNF